MGYQCRQEKLKFGHAYVNCKTKKAMPARDVGSPCRDGCFSRIRQEGVQKIFSEFWVSRSYDSQNAYIQDMVEMIPVNRKHTKKEHSKRNKTPSYFVMHDNKRLRCAS